MRYTWNETKNRRNLKVHGVEFEDAVRVFEGPTLERVDDRYDYGEERMYAIGVVNGMGITVIYAGLDAGERRIISAWRSEPHERRAYWKSIKGLSH